MRACVRACVRAPVRQGLPARRVCVCVRVSECVFFTGCCEQNSQFTWLHSTHIRLLTNHVHVGAVLDNAAGDVLHSTGAQGAQRNCTQRVGTGTQIEADLTECPKNTPKYSCSPQCSRRHRLLLLLLRGHFSPFTLL